MVEPFAVDVPLLAPRTTILSAFLTVESLWAIMIVVIPPPFPDLPTKLSMADCTIFSLSLSRALKG